MENNGFANLTVHDGVGTVFFGHPKGNSMPGTLLQKIRILLEECDERSDVSVVVLRSDGERVFCAGASFDELLAVDSEESGLAFFSGFANVINTIRKMKKFVVGVVEGKAVGGGVGLIAACDYVIANHEASLKLSELAIGIGPFVIGPAVKRKIGITALTSLTLNPKQWKDANWGREKGLYNRVVAQDYMETELQNFVDPLKMYSADASEEIKRTLWVGTEHWDELLLEKAQVSGRLVLSEYTRNALNHFKNK